MQAVTGLCYGLMSKKEQVRLEIPTQRRISQKSRPYFPLPSSRSVYTGRLVFSLNGHTNTDRLSTGWHPCDFHRTPNARLIICATVTSWTRSTFTVCHRQPSVGQTWTIHPPTHSHGFTGSILTACSCVLRRFL